MNLRSVGISALVLLIICLLYQTIGVGITLLIFALIFLAQAILFSVHTEYYDKFLSFINPGLYNAYCQKGSDFIRKKRKMNIISYYLLSGVMGLNASMQMRLRTKIDTTPLFSLREFLPLALVLLGICILLNFVAILAVKKSKTAGEDLMWNIVIGLVFAVILFGFISFYIVRSLV